MKEISYDEFLKDIRRQKREREIEKPAKEPWEVHPEALSRGEYDRLTRHGRRRLKRPRPVWLTGKKRWTVGAPVNPIEWQILVHSEPRRGRSVSSLCVEEAMARICGQLRLNRFAFSKCVDRLCDRGLLKIMGGFRRLKIADKWLSPDLTGQRAGGEWHRRSIHDFTDEVCRLCGCYTYADRGYYPGVEMPDVITLRPRLVDQSARHNLGSDSLEWDFENPIYVEFKSAQDMRDHSKRLKNQLERYNGVPLYLRVEARVFEVKDMLEERGRREVGFFDLLKKPEGDMVFLTGSERPWAEQSFKPVVEKIREAFLETYDKKARLRKTGVDPEGREHHDLILYDASGTAKNVGQVIPDHADDVEDFAGLYFGERYLGRIATADYVYEPERKPTFENKTWAWKKRKTKGSKFRSFRA